LPRENEKSMTLTEAKNIKFPRTIYFNCSVGRHLTPSKGGGS
jgi:hypothetical protein